MAVAKWLRITWTPTLTGRLEGKIKGLKLYEKGVKFKFSSQKWDSINSISCRHRVSLKFKKKVEVTVENHSSPSEAKNDAAASICSLRKSATCESECACGCACALRAWVHLIGPTRLNLFLFCSSSGLSAIQVWFTPPPPSKPLMNLPPPWTS